LNKDIIFEGYERWFKKYLVSKGNRFVAFWGNTTLGVLTLDDMVDIEDEFSITFTCVEKGQFIFRINYED
jgi:hypothetical protein